MEINTITAIIVAKNEELVIEDALKSIQWCSKIIHIDNGSTDTTKTIVKRYNGESIKTNFDGFDERKNFGLSKVLTPWAIFIDADERISPQLRLEIITLINSDSSIKSADVAFQIPRRNIYLSREMKYGGWGNDKVIRLFKTKHLQKFEGSLHEQPVVNGTIGNLTYQIIHLSHRELESMIEKTIIFTQKEASLRITSNHPRVLSWRLFRVMLTEFCYRFLRKLAFMDKTEGLIDGIFQVFNTFIIYARVWENQNSKTILTPK